MSVFTFYSVQVIMKFSCRYIYYCVPIIIIILYIRVLYINSNFNFIIILYYHSRHQSIVDLDLGIDDPDCP